MKFERIARRRKVLERTMNRLSRDFRGRKLFVRNSVMVPARLKKIEAR